MRPLNEQRILVTGSTDGLGRVVAAELVERGATVLVHGRDAAKVEAVTRELGAHEGLTADLADLDQVRSLAGSAGELDTLVNNAGVIVAERRQSAQGHELTFAVNHLAHFELTRLMREPARIVNVSSIGRRRSTSTTSCSSAATSPTAPTPRASSPRCCSPSSWPSAWGSGR